MPFTTLKYLRAAALPVAALLAYAAPAFAEAPLTKPEVLARADEEDMLPVLKKLEELGAKDFSKLTVPEARTQPTPADAVKAVLEDRGKDPKAIMEALKVSQKDMSYPTGGGTQPIRVYTPQGLSGPLPVIVYYHGGGWVVAGIETYEASAIALAHRTGAIVASVEYRHAPEHPFPAAHEDAFNAYEWVVGNAGSFGGDGSRVALAGESAGGNLAVATAIAARDAKVQRPVAVLSVYPVAGTDLTTPSYVSQANATPLSKAGMEWFFSHTLAKPEDKADPRLNLYAGADLKGLPPVTIVNAELDPLRSDGELLAKALKAAGVDVERDVQEGVTHEFFGMAPLLDDAVRAQEFAAQRLKAAFAKGK